MHVRDLLRILNLARNQQTAKTPKAQFRIPAYLLDRPDRLPLWALNGDLGGRHHDGDLINPFQFTYIYIYILHLSYIQIDYKTLPLARSTWLNLDHALRVCWIQIALASRLYR